MSDFKKEITYLDLMLADAKKQSQNSRIINLINDYQISIKNEKKCKDMTDAITLVNALLGTLESLEEAQPVIDYMKNHGFYRILYHKPIIKGQDIDKSHGLLASLRYGFVGVALSALIIILFAAVSFIAAPFWLTAIATGLFVGASTYLSGVLYGVVNDLFGTHANLPYFLLGHQRDQASLLRTNNKVAQAIAWGVGATFIPMALVAGVFLVAATAAAFFLSVATFILPVLMVAMPLIAVAADIYARKLRKKYTKTEIYIRNGNEHDLRNSLWGNDYQKAGLKFMNPTVSEKAAWYANGERNIFGFSNIPFVFLAAFAGMLGLSGASAFLPPLLFSPLIAVALPVAFAAVVVITLSVAGIYTYVNRNQQRDDRYRLQYEEVEPGLYLDEDMDYINKLEETLEKTKETTSETVKENNPEEVLNFPPLFTNKGSIVNNTNLSLETVFDL